uniref:Uncharacterized protein n=1 Tax=Oryza barthii TaxID=65489 RepID=A0A0D3GNF4_9ORYZ
MWSGRDGRWRNTRPSRSAERACQRGEGCYAATILLLLVGAGGGGVEQQIARMRTWLGRDGRWRARALADPPRDPATTAKAAAPPPSSSSSSVPAVVAWSGRWRGCGRGWGGTEGGGGRALTDAPRDPATAAKAAAPSPSSSSLSMPAAAAWSVRRRWPPVSPHRAFEAAVPFQAKSTGREKEGKRRGNPGI